MNNNEILNKYIDLIDKGYCCACNELNCIDKFPQTKITHAIRKLQQENKQLKDNWNKLKEYIKETKLKEFEKSYGKRYGKTFTQAEVVVCNMILNKMQKIEQGSDSNGNN